MPTPSKEYADEVLIRRLAHGDTIAEAARIAKVSERTVYRRLTNPAFRQRLGATQAAALSPAYGMLTTGLNDACSRLTRLVWDPNPHVGFKASKAVVDLTLKMREQVDIEDRVTVLEGIAFDKDKCGVDPDEDNDDEGPEDDLGPGGTDGGPTDGRPGGPGSNGPPPRMPFYTAPGTYRPASSGSPAPTPGGAGVPGPFPPAAPRPSAADAVAPIARPEVSPPSARGNELAPAGPRRENRPGDCQNLPKPDTGPRTTADRPGTVAGQSSCAPRPGAVEPGQQRREPDPPTSGRTDHRWSSAGRLDPPWLRAWKSVRGLPKPDKHCHRGPRPPAR